MIQQKSDFYWKKNLLFRSGLCCCSCFCCLERSEKREAGVDAGGHTLFAKSAYYPQIISSLHKDTEHSFFQRPVIWIWVPPDSVEDHSKWLTMEKELGGVENAQNMLPMPQNTGQVKSHLALPWFSLDPTQLSAIPHQGAWYQRIKSTGIMPQHLLESLKARASFSPV